jgi:hypothetical protein
VEEIADDDSGDVLVYGAASSLAAPKGGQQTKFGDPKLC